ncbi:HAD family hydrolase [Xanthovirga aplysinae]|uniref:HAD family hydrolase n=1 Tax=Xanthovirga aplysinae TaxID=2529853 RepID=UPI0012BBE614|nr:HAD family phosphatase [Xanthovirga aplysinae]MTI32089.1 HAD family phosphatase [Xanthovirga aplysinae]
MSIKNIIFDFGGVLIDWNPRYLYEKVFQEKAEMDFFLKNICNQEWNVKQDAGRLLSEATVELQKQYPKYKTEIQRYYDDWLLMLGGEISENVKLIKPLKLKYKLFGLTNWSAETFPIALNRYSFFRDLDGMVVSGNEKMIKPDKSIYELLLKRYHLQANESLFIDDNFENIVAARELGFQTIHFREGSVLEEQFRLMNLL